jgi:hypothetical protein
MFYEVVKNDMANSKETSFNNTISTTLSFITVLFEDLFEAINIQAVLVGEKVNLNHPSNHQKNPIHVMDMTLTLISSTMMSIMQSKKNR